MRETVLRLGAERDERPATKPILRRAEPQDSQSRDSQRIGADHAAIGKQETGAHTGERQSQLRQQARDGQGEADNGAAHASQQQQQQQHSGEQLAQLLVFVVERRESQHRAGRIAAEHGQVQGRALLRTGDHTQSA